MQVVRKSKLGPRGATVLALMVLAVLAGGLGLGARVLTTGAQTSEDIHGCVNNYSGVLRITSAGGKCTPAERPLSWSKVPAGTVLDRMKRERSVVVNSEDESSMVSGDVGCPDGYSAVLGGAFQLHSSGAHAFAMRSNTPYYSIPGRPVGWQATWVTVDGKPAVGHNEFIISVVCEMRAE